MFTTFVGLTRFACLAGEVAGLCIGKKSGSEGRKARCQDFRPSPAWYTNLLL